jgi:hypothetical protein
MGNNRVLRGEDFYQRYGVSPEGLVLWLDQSDPRSYGDAQNWYDLSGKSNHAVQATASKQPSITGGNFLGKSRLFDGLNDKMIVSDDSSLDFTTNLSLFAWFKMNERSRMQSLISKAGYSLKIGADDRLIFSGRGLSDGTTWVEVEDTTETRIYSFVVFNGYLYAGTGYSGKIYRSSDGTTWVSPTSTPESRIYSFVVFNGYLYAGTGDNGKIYRSSDGTTWVEVEDTTESLIYCLVVFNGYLYAGTGYSGKIYRMGSGFDIYSSDIISLDEIVFVVGAYDNSLVTDNAQLYVFCLNGKLADSLNFATALDTNALDMIIGSSYGSTQGGGSSSGEEYFKGNLFILGATNKTFSKAEGQRLYLRDAPRFGLL